MARRDDTRSGARSGARGSARGGARTQPGAQERAQGAQARLAATVMAGTMLLWMGAQWLGGEMGWEARFVFLFDLVALLAFGWALLMTWRLWRSRGGR